MKTRRETNHRPARVGDRGGFTLVELMVVVVILGLLAGAVGFSVRSYLASSRRSVAEMEIAKLTQAVDTFYTVVGTYPESRDGLAALTEPSDRFPDGLITKDPVDPWGNPYQYVRPAADGPFEVFSLGADGREGGEGEDADVRPGGEDRP